MGEDAEQFATNQDATVGNDSGDLLGDGETAAAASTFESQFPDLAGPSAVGFSHLLSQRTDQGKLTSDQQGMGGTSGGITAPSVNYNSGYQSYAADEEEPEVIKEWREKRDAQNAKRAEQFAAQREETIKEAQKNIDDFYENYNTKKDKGIAQTRKDAEKFLADREDTVSGGTSWDRIAKLVDVSGKGAHGGAAGSGKERFREMLTTLKKDEKAPGATGY